MRSLLHRSRPDLPVHGVGGTQTERKPRDLPGAAPGREVCTMLTGKWVTADDGALVMQWTEQEREETPEQNRQEMATAA
jgi:hypothetical protein